jgi:hypothetical protein
VKKLRVHIASSVTQGGDLMKATKTFDCVALKDSIQARLREQRTGLTESDVRARVQKTLAESESPVARLWRKLLSAKR